MRLAILGLLAAFFGFEFFRGISMMFARNSQRSRIEPPRVMHGTQQGMPPIHITQVTIVGGDKDDRTEKTEYCATTVYGGDSTADYHPPVRLDRFDRFGRR